MIINRRKLMAWMGASGGTALAMRWSGAAEAFAAESPVLSGIADPAASETRWERSAAHKHELTKDVTWLTHEPLVYQLRRGNHYDDLPETYRRMIEPDNIKRMADAGVAFGRIYFYKGFGLSYEMPHIQQAKRAAELMHKLGMKVSVYVAGTMFTETFYQEIPEARGWEQRDCWDHWIPYGIQTFRHYPCHNNPAFQEYFRRVMKTGVEEVGADELAFDQIGLQAEPKSCRCPYCIKAFEVYLKKHYPTSDAAKRRFGLPDVDWIRVNQWESPEEPGNLAVLDDPVLQEWTRFRCESLANHATRLHDYAKSLNPNVSVSFNMKGVYCFNRYWTNAVYHPLFTGKVDRISFDTGGYYARIDPGSGALISQIRSYKVARRLGSCSEESGSLDDDLHAAVFMAFGYQKAVCGPTSNGPGSFNVFTPLMEFFREYNERYYTETDTVTDVATFRNWPSMAYSISATYVPVTLMEQVLIQHKIPFDLLFQEQLDHISRYAAVILAGQECLSDEQAATLMQYVRNGGTLIVSGTAGQFNEWREQRRSSPLPSARREGKGRIVSIPEVVRADVRPKAVSSDQNEDPEPGATMHKGQQLTPKQWVLPKNHEEIHSSIVAALPSGLSITAEAPLTTVMELLTRPKTQETIVHFINFDRKNNVAPFAVTLRKQFPGPVKSVSCMSSEADSSASLKFTESDGWVKFTVPAMKVYSMIVVAS